MRFGLTGNLSSGGFFSASSMVMFLYEIQYGHYKTYPLGGQSQTSPGMRTRIKINLMILIAAPILCAVTGCDPMTPQDRAFFDRRERSRSERESIMRQASDGARPEDLFQLVKDSAAPDEQGLTADWLGRQLEALGGQVMFPRWTTTRRGSNKQDIQFDFVHIDESNNTRRMAYTWPVDVLTMRIGDMRLDVIEQSASLDQSMMEQQNRRIREHEQTLR